ncbi:MAG: DUF2007 domain-containing protein [Planctomycetes bacterium]|nr:DUF2007 domain-containing protein [Planctomycetota bacterium]NMD36996.1 DUF2007 domain-containing protein [Planctomycetota bacterium]
MGTLVTVSTFYTPSEAHLAKMRLESSGIPTFVEDENIFTMQPLLVAAVAGIKLRVRESDAERARATLGEHPGQVASDDTESEVCPCCGSRNCEVSQLGRRLAFLSVLLLQFPIGSSRQWLKCLQCGHKWRYQGPC